jgi:hypothetical protein
MQARRVSLTGSAVCVLLAGPALAAGKGGPAPIAIAAIAIPLVGAMVQFLVAVLLPRFTLRLQRAIAEGFWPMTGWGAMVTVLTVILAVMFSQGGGGAGKTLAAVVGVAVLVLALTGGVGISKILGDWTLRRWEVEPVGPLSVLCGATVWAWGAAVPIVGWAAGLLGLFASLGAAVQVLLQPQAFDPPEAPVAPQAPATPVTPAAPEEGVDTVDAPPAPT